MPTRVVVLQRLDERDRRVIRRARPALRMQGRLRLLREREENVE